MIFAIILSLLATITLVVNADNFLTADTNGDGALDRKEFAMYLHKIDTSISSLLTVPDDLAAEVAKEASIGFDLDSFTRGTDFIHGCWNSLLVILVTELGDKTFFIAAIMAMRYGRGVVYAGAMGALGLMHVLSCIMGLALPNILPREYTHFASGILFLYFGLRLLKEAFEMGDGPSEELQEAEEEVGKEKGDEEGDEETGKPSGMSFNKNSGQLDLTVLTQAFTVTFLAEWGDRSQIATIGLAASKNVFGVILGGLVGHAFCTGLAVVGGKMMASKISPKTIGYVGGVTFLCFGVLVFF
jgi:putative Ca2+/H+ antiporter (TMEM165/GDT1 family)